MDHGVPSRINNQRSIPYHPATFHAIIMRMAIANMIGFELTVPASKNEKFINAPKNAAIPVKQPTIKPSPTNISPKTMKYEKNPELVLRCLLKSDYVFSNNKKETIFIVPLPIVSFVV